MLKKLAFLLLATMLVTAGIQARVSIGKTSIGVLGPYKSFYGVTGAGYPVPILKIDSSGQIEIDPDAGGTSVTGALTLDSTTSMAGDLTFSGDANIVQNGMTVIRDVVSIADDGNVTLNASVTGVLEIFVEGDDEYAIIHISDDASVAEVFSLGSVALIDSDTNLCVYNGGTAVVIKNRLSSTKNICYEFKYK